MRKSRECEEKNEKIMCQLECAKNETKWNVRRLGLELDQCLHLVYCESDLRIKVDKRQKCGQNMRIREKNLNLSQNMITVIVFLTLVNAASAMQCQSCSSFSVLENDPSWVYGLFKSLETEGK